MSSLLVRHVSAGALGIVSGAAAVCVRKGERRHRVFGTAFVLSMLIVSALTACLAIFVPPISSGAAPPSASVAVAFLTIRLAATAWMTVRRTDGAAGRFGTGACLAAGGIAVALLMFGLRAAIIPMARPGAYVPCFVLASFAAFVAALDLKMTVRGGTSGAQRVARHLWRMCLALFFATAFFFLGQQQVLPKAMRGSPIPVVVALAPLVLMIFWLFRVRFSRRFKS
jgi:hypothetical protein